MRNMVSAALVALILVLPAQVLAQADSQPVATATTVDSLDIPKILAVAGGAVLGVVFFNMLSGNVLASRLLEDLGRGVAIIGAGVLGGAGGHYAYTHWDDMVAPRE